MKTTGMLRRAATALAALLLGAGAAVSVAAPASAGTTGPYYLVNQHSGKCLGISNASTANGAKAMQWTCAWQPWSDQGWYLDDVVIDSTSYTQIRNQRTGMCLGIDQAGTANGALAIQAVCSGARNQAWTVDDTVTFQLINAKSGKCLGISAAGLANGALAMQWTCAYDPYSDQIWAIDAF